VKVSLISTVKDPGPAMHDFLASLERQTRHPDEVIIVDGGSRDGTLDVLRSAQGVTAVSEPGANISRGRNVAIRAATHDVIAATDADCILADDWLENLLDPIERGADVAAGFYEPLCNSFFEICSSAVSVREPDELRPGWMPSARSMAFRRDAYEAAGGFPEWLNVGEDMYLNHRLRASGARVELAPRAVVRWRIRPTLWETWRQYAGYAEGDALAGMYPERHFIRLVTYAFALAAMKSRNRLLVGLAAAGGVAYASRPLRRGWHRLQDSPGRPASLIVIPSMMVFIDAAKMWGYLRGLGTLLHRPEARGVHGPYATGRSP
jgi:glycosyltransferase involved in cell wall biosynthesis